MADQDRAEILAVQPIPEGQLRGMTDMDLYRHREACCGCSACKAVCSVGVGAIVMVPDEEGFLYPVVDEALCIRCCRCILVCPFKKIESEAGQ